LIKGLLKWTYEKKTRLRIKIKFSLIYLNPYPYGDQSFESTLSSYDDGDDGQRDRDR
jgi:hypothetical protein